MKKKQVLITMLSASLVCAAAAVTFAACGEETLYNVTYEKGGTAVEGTLPTEGAHKEGDKFTIADNTLTNEGYEFDGWTYGGTTYEEGAEFTMPAADVTFTAKWAELLTVTYEWDGGEKPEGAAEDAELPAATTVKYDTKLTLPTLAAKENYTFSGWKLATTGNFVASPYTITANITLKAVFTKSGFFMVNYSFGEEGENHAAATAQLPPAVEYTKGSTVTLAPAPAAKTGWAFDGWVVRNATTNAPVPLDEESDTTFTMPSFNVLITATWVQTFSVTYAWNTADGRRPESATDSTLPTPNPVTEIKSGTEITLPTLEGKGGYQFDGWQDEAGNLIPVADPYTYKVTANVTLKAIFSREGYYGVTYNYGEHAAAGETAPIVEDFQGGQTFTIAAAPAAAAGWKFAGWEVKDADDGDVTVNNTEGTYTFTMPAKAVTITALWKQLFTLTFVLGDGQWAEGKAPETSIAEGTEIQLPDTDAATNGEFTLLGWKSGETEYEPGDDFAVTENATFIAVWSKEVANPGALAWNTLAQSISLKYGQKVTLTADVNISGTAAWSGVFVGIGDKTDTTKNIHLRLDNWFADYTHNGAYQHQYGQLLFKTEKEFLLTKNNEPVADWFDPLLSLYAHVKDYKAVADYTAEGRIVVTTTFNATLNEDNYTYTGTATYTALNPHVALAQEYKLGIGGDSATATNLKYVLEGAVKEVPAPANPDHNFAGGDACTLCGAKKVTTEGYEGVAERIYTFVQRAANDGEGWFQAPSTPIALTPNKDFAIILTGENADVNSDNIAFEFVDGAKIFDIRLSNKDKDNDTDKQKDIWGADWGDIIKNTCTLTSSGSMPAKWVGNYEFVMTYINGTFTIKFTFTGTGDNSGASFWAQFVQENFTFGEGTVVKLSGGSPWTVRESWQAYYGTLSAIEE